MSDQLSPQGPFQLNILEPIHNVSEKCPRNGILVCERTAVVDSCEHQKNLQAPYFTTAPSKMRKARGFQVAKEHRTQ